MISKRMLSTSSKECSATSSNWWSTDIHASAWSTNTATAALNYNNNNNSWNNLTNPNNMNSSNSTCEDPDDVSLSNNSFTNNTAASNHSGLSIDSSSQRFVDNTSELIGETPSDHHLWNQVLLNVGSNGGVQNGQNLGDIQLLNSFSAKNLTTGLMFDPACDYLKKMDSGWDFSNPPSFNTFDKSFSGYKETVFENERLSKLSNMVSNWSIAPPQPEINCHQFGQQSSNVNNHHQYQQPSVNESTLTGLLNGFQIEQPLVGRPVTGAGGDGYQMEDNNSMNVVGDNSKYFYGLNPDLSFGSCSSKPSTNINPDLSFGSCLSKPSTNISVAKTVNMKNNFYSKSEKQSTPITYPNFQTFSAPSSTTARSLRKEHMSTAGEGKKKRSDNYEDNYDTNLKKPKHDDTFEAILPAALKLFQPHPSKPKLADKITAIQQIVSPFGKTDTASVLWEAIGYINCLHDQIEERWRGTVHTKGSGDLKSRGLCLMPVSSTPPVYRDNSGPDFWAPSYRGFLHR